MQVILQQVEILREIFIINRNSNVDSEVKLMDELYDKWYFFPHLTTGFLKSHIFFFFFLGIEKLIFTFFS